MPTLHLPEVDLHYEVSGSGPPLLLIAGMMSDSASWLPLLPLLEPHFRVIRPDNRTTGQTKEKNGDTGIIVNAQDCMALLDHLSIAKVHILGHSMGGLIGLQMAHTAPDRVYSLTLASSAPVRMNRNIALFNALVAVRNSDATPDTWLRALLPWLFSASHFDDPTVIDAAIEAALAYPYAQPADAMQRQVIGLSAFDPTTFQKPVSCPTLALLAKDDLLIPPSIALKAFESVTGIKTQIIPDAGHSIHWDAPEAVAAALESFVAGLKN